MNIIWVEDQCSIEVGTETPEQNRTSEHPILSIIQKVG